jgi:hypothetical protein
MKFKIQYRLANSAQWFPTGKYFATWSEAMDGLDRLKTRNNNNNDSRIVDFRTVPVRGKW